MGLISASIIDSDIVLMITARRDRYCAYLMVRVTTAHIIDMVISSTRIRWCFMSMLPASFTFAVWSCSGISSVAMPYDTTHKLLCRETGFRAVHLYQTRWKG